MNGMPPHIAQLVVGHRDINTTMGYKAVYPDEVINGHRAFIARRRATRPSEEYSTPADEDERSSSATSSGDESLSAIPAAPTAPAVSTGTLTAMQPPPARSHATPATPRHPGQYPRPHREAEREGWLGEVTGLAVSLAGADQKLPQLDQRPAGHDRQLRPARLW